MRKAIVFGVAVLIVSFVLCGLGFAQTEVEKVDEPQKTEVPKPTQAPKATEAPEEAKTITVTYGDVILTLEDLEELFAAKMAKDRRNRRQRRGSTFSSLAEKSQDSFIEDLVFEQATYEEGLKAGMENDEAVIKSMNDWDLNPGGQLFADLYEVHIRQKVLEVTEEDMKKYYEENIEKYTKEFSFKMKHIFLSTYKEYTVKEGDTLPGIAAKESRDEAKAELILDERKSKVAQKSEDGKVESEFALIPGAKLNVPMNEDEVADVRKRIEKIKAELTTENFDEYIQKYSETDDRDKGKVIGPLPVKGSKQEILPEVIESAKKTTIGSLSDILQTKHGFQIMKIVSKTDEERTPFDKVKTRIERILAQDREQARMKKVIEDALKRPEYETFFEVLADEDAKDDAVVAKIGDYEYTLGRHKRRLKGFPRRATEQQRAEYKSVQKQIELLTTHKKEYLEFSFDTVIKRLLANTARELGVDKTEKYIEERKKILRGVVGKAYLDKVFEERIKPTEDDLREYLTENLSKRYTKAETWEFHMISKVAKFKSSTTDEQKEEMRQANLKKIAEIRKRLDAGEDFEALAKEESDDIRTGKHGGQVGPVRGNYRGGKFMENVKKLKVGQLSEAFLSSNNAYVIRLDKFQPAQPMKFEDESVREKVEKDYAVGKRAEITKSLTSKASKDLGLKIERK